MIAIITMIVILIVKDCLTKLTLQKDYLRPSNCKEKTEHLGKIKYKVFNKHTWTSHIVLYYAVLSSPQMLSNT